MLLLIHINIAIVSIFCTTYAVFQPSKKMLQWSVWLMLTTLGSGVALVFVAHVPFVKVCLSGLLYLVYTLALTFLMKKKLAVIP